MNNITPVSKRRMIFILPIIVMIGVCSMLGVDIHLASMPYIMHSLHTDKAHMQQTIAIYLLGMGVSLLFYGPLSDRFGRKPLIIFGLLLAAVASFACVFSMNIQYFLVTRLLQGIGAGACLGLVRVVIGDLLTGMRLATVASYLGLAAGVVPLLSPALGGYIQHWFNWRANFIFLGAFLLVSAILFLLVCPETNRCKNKKACLPRVVLRNYMNLLSHKVFVSCTLFTGIAMAATMAYATSSSFILQNQFHVTPIVYGWLTAVVEAGGFMGRLCATALIRKCGRPAMLKIGFILLLSAGVWVLFFIGIHKLSIAVLLIAVFVTLFAQAQVMPAAMSYALAPFSDKRGAAGALYGGFQMLIAFLSSAIVGALTHDGVLILGVCYTLLGVLGLGVYLKIKEKLYAQ